jgi:hypothetical protein
MSDICIKIMCASTKKEKLTVTSSVGPHSPFLYVMRTWLLVGRNSNPSSSQGTSTLAVPGFPSAVSADIDNWEDHFDLDDVVEGAWRSGEKALVDVATADKRAKIVRVMFMMLNVFMLWSNI